MRKVGGWDWVLDWEQDQGRQMQQDSGGSLGCGSKGNKKRTAAAVLKSILHFHKEKCISRN